MFCSSLLLYLPRRLASRLTALLLFGLCLLRCIGSAYGQTPRFVWGRSATTSLYTPTWSAEFHSTALDHAGNVYGLAQSEGTLSIGPLNLPRRSDCKVQALVKYDSTGQLLWSKTLQPTLRSVQSYYGVLRQIAVDADGNVFGFGSFNGNYNAAPALIIDGDTVLRGSPLGSFFVVKWAPDGQLLWTSSSAAPRHNSDFFLNAMAVGPTGDVYLGGTVGVNYDSVGVGPVAMAYSNMFSPWFLVQLSGETGQVDWVRLPRAYQWNGPVAATMRIEKLAADAAGNVYALGLGSNFRVDSLRFASPYIADTLVGSRADTCFWLKFSPHGRALAGRQLAAHTDFSFPGGFAVDPVGNSFLLVNQELPDSVAYSPVPGAPPRQLALGEAYGLLKLNPVGALEWLKPWPGPSELATDAAGRLYAGGPISSRGVRLDGLFLPTGPSDAFVAVLDAATGQARHLLPVRGNRAEATDGLTANAAGQLAVAISSASDSTLLDQRLTYARVGRAAGKGVLARVSTYTNLLRGAVFVDENRNGVQDGPEAGYPFGTVVKVLPGNDYFVPSAGGLYQAPVQRGTYSVSLATRPLYHTVVTLPPAATTFAAFGNEAPGASYALRPIPGQQDLQVFLSSSIADLNSALPGHLGLSYRNIGTVPIDSGTVTLVYDSLLVYVTSTIPPATRTGQTLTWKFRDLRPGQVRHIGSDFDLSSAQEGSTLRSHVVLEPLAGDLTPTDNRAEVREIVISTWGAPDTATVSFRQITPQQAQAGQWLDYTVRFRNPSPDSIYRIVLRDTLPATLRQETLDVVDASHPFQWTLEPGGVLAVRLDGARLGGTTAPRPGGAGYVHFRVQPQPGLQVGDLIQNRASVYLDDQPALTTRPAITTVQAIVTGETATPAALGVNVWPNPTTGPVELHAWLPQAGPLTLRLRDVTGRLVRQERHSAAAGPWQGRLTLAELPAGLYLLEVQTPTAHLSRRVVLSPQR